ncbi:MAG: ankyrin repeat domain-containing protein [Wolbachia sp.]
MLGQGNIRKQVAVGQMNVEDSLSSEIECKLNCESQENPGPSSASSYSHHSELTDDESVIETANAASDKVIIEEVANCFVKTFVKEFEKKVREYSEEAKPNSNIRKSGKLTAAADSVIKSSVGPGVYLPSVDPISIGGQILYTGAKKIIDCGLEKRHRKKAKVISKVIHSFKFDKREVLVEAGLEIFQKFEEQFAKVIDIGKDIQWGSRERAIQELAIDAVSRVINYILANKEEFSVDLITQGVVLGESKNQGYFTRPGYEIKDEQNGKSLVTSELYEWVGIKKKEEDETVNYYQYNSEEHNLEEYGCAEKYGYRLPFEWELRKWEKVKQKYVSSEAPIERYVYILNDEKKEKLARFILKEINEQDPVKRKDIEDVKEHLRKQDEDRRQFSYSFDKTPENFIERKEVVKNLNLRLHSSSQEVKMSRVVLISGKSGIGKSELARSYGFSERRKGTWDKIMWIDASSNTNLSKSFRGLAERLGISKKSEQRRERNIKSIVEDVYEHLQDTKSLFVFDNASSYKKIKSFLPSSFPIFSNREKPYVLITSSNKNWKGVIEDIEEDIEIDKFDNDNLREKSEEEIQELGNSDSDDIEEIKLGNFKKEEAEKLIQKSLGDRGSDNDLLLQKVGYFPLDLASAVGCIKEKGLDIKEYLTKYKVTQQLNPDLFKVQDSNENLLGIFSINIDEIKGAKNIGQLAYDLLVFMAYMDPHYIDTVKIFSQRKLKEDKQKIKDALVRLNCYSAIQLNKEKTIAKIHKKVQEIVRLRQKEEKKEEEVLRKIMTSLIDNKCKDISHIVSVWNYASEYDKLIDEFIESDYDGSSILHFLAIDGSEEVIKLILEKLEKKVDPSKLNRIINASDKIKITSLGYAIMYGHLELVKLFMKKEYSLRVNSNLNHPLYWAAMGNQLEIVKYFIDNRRFQFDIGVVLYAIQGNSLDVVRYCVEEKKIDINLKDKKGEGYLHHAVQSGNLDTVKYLVQKGIDVDQQNKDNVSPLLYAATTGNIHIIRYLVEKKANITLKDKYGYNILHFAAFDLILNFIVPTEWRQKMNLKTLSCWYVVDHFSLRNVKYLIGKGIDVNSCDRHRMTLLHYAAESGNLYQFPLYKQRIDNNGKKAILK